MSNDIGLVWDKILKQLDVNDLQWLSDNNVFVNNDNKYVQQMNGMLLAHLDEVKIGV
ncbi:hypothetical protein [Lysinibacillus capsici]|uniref:hypothetical protein n=1 Tax=Lysinibacillus capsici TaxID=2115968 RepID=UPI00289ABB03|nr:hypothetical protein [Lysinibacillus capsici]